MIVLVVWSRLLAASEAFVLCSALSTFAWGEIYSLVGESPRDHTAGLSARARASWLAAACRRGGLHGFGEPLIFGGGFEPIGSHLFARSVVPALSLLAPAAPLKCALQQQCHLLARTPARIASHFVVLERS